MKPRLTAALAAALSLALFASACSPESALAWTKKSTATLARHLDRAPALSEVAAEFRPFNEAVQRLERLDAAAALEIAPLAERVAAAADRATGGRASDLVRKLARAIASRLKNIAGGSSPAAGAKELKEFERDLRQLEALLSE